MLEQIKRLTRHSLVYGIGHIMSRFIGFLLLPVHTHVLPPSEYRTPALLFSSLAILNVIFSYGMDVAFLRFFIMEEDKEKKKTVFSTAFWMILLTGMLFSAGMMVFPNPFSRLIFGNTGYAHLIRLGAGILLADALCLLPFLVLRAEERSVSFVLAKSAGIILNLGFNVLFVLNQKRGVIGVFEANFIASALTLLILLPVVFRWLKVRFHNPTLADLLRFGLPYVPSGLSIIVMDQIGRFFLDRIHGEEATGIFSANYKLGVFMAILVSAFRFAWHPFFLSVSKQKNAPLVYARVLTYFTFVMAFIFLGISLFIQEIIRIQLFGIRLMGEGFGAGIEIVPVVLLAYAVYGMDANFVVGVYIRKKTHWMILVTGIGALTAVLFNVLLVPSFSIVGAAWSTFFGYAAMALSLFFVNRRLYPVPYEYYRLLHLTVAVALFFVLGSHLWTSLWMRLILVVLFLPFLYCTRFFNQGERSKLMSFFKFGTKS